MISIPKKIKIGPQSWTVVERERATDGLLDDGSYGYTLPNANLIVLDANIPHSKKRSVMLHEILHAVRLQYDPTQKPSREADLDEWEHFFIGVWDNGLLGVLRDNPKLVEWLVEVDK